MGEPANDVIGIDDFKKIKLKIARVLSAENVEKSNKLIKLTVSLGDKTKTILSGIRRYYSPEELVNKKVVVIDNLKPARLFGLESEGMVLAAVEGEDNLTLLCPDKDIKEGSEIS